MVLQGQYHYLHEGEVASFGGEEALRKALSATGEYGVWIRNHAAIIKINDALFMHGGLSPAYAKRPLRELNETIRRELRGEAAPNVIDDSDGPLWYRGLTHGGEADLEPQVKVIAATHGVERVVLGHTVTRSGVTVLAGGRVILIDVGMTHAFGGPAECLVIENGVFTAVSPTGTRELPVKGAKAGAPAKP
jgi:hypothetical protein